MDGVFVTGTDTGVGKTVICAGLLNLLHASHRAVYWKPVQTGTIVGDDTKGVQSLTGLSAENFWEPSYRFPEPLSPHMAAKKWGRTVELDVLKKYYADHKKKDNFPIVEGAGGILVPYNEKTLQIDFIQALKLPILIVTEDRVGAINQSLLTLNAAKDAKIPVIGIVLTKARKTLGNGEAISLFGKVEVLAEFDPTGDSRSIIAQVGGSARLREVFKSQALPT